MLHIPEDELYAFALGEGDAATRAGVQQHIRGCPECGRMLAETQLALSALSLALPEVELPSRMRQRVLADVANADPVAMPPRVMGGTAPATSRGWKWAFAFAAVAAVLLLVVALGINIRSTALQQQVAVLNARNQELQRSQSVMQSAMASNVARQAELQSAAAALAAMSAPDTVRFVLTRANEKPEPQVRAYYRKSTGQVMMTAMALPPVPAGKAYELWLLGDGAPKPAGVFRPDANGSVALMTHAMANNLPVTGFGLTVEDAKGSPVPTPPILLASK